MVLSCAVAGNPLMRRAAGRALQDILDAVPDSEMIKKARDGDLRDLDASMISSSGVSG